MAAYAILAAVLLVTSTSAATLPPEPEPWLTGLRFPVNMAWAPDETLFFAEKELGNVRMVVDGELAPEPVAHVDVTVSFETGLLGIAVDPEWPDEPWLYLYYSDAADARNRLIRIRVEDGREVDRETLVDALPTAAAYHNGGDMLFGADGMLYLTVGDAHDGERAQDPADLGGKVLRLMPDGSIPADNPIPGTLTYTLGHRNSFGLCVDPATGDLWETENGEPVEELNRLRAGANYGWPVGQGALNQKGFQDPVITLTEVAPTGCAIWRGHLYFATYGDGILRRLALDGSTSGTVFGFDEPAFDLVVGPDDRLYASTGATIWRFAAPPRYTAPVDPIPETGTPVWVFAAIGVALAVSLMMSIRAKHGAVRRPAASGTRPSRRRLRESAAGGSSRAPSRPPRSGSGSRPGCARATAPRSTPTSSFGSSLSIPGSSVDVHQPLAHLLDADTHDHLEPALRGDPRGFLAHDPLLEPEHLRADRHGVPGHLGRVLRPPEHVHDVDGGLAGDVEERGVGLLTEHLLLVRIDRHDPIAVVLQVRGHLVGRPPGLRRDPHDGDHVSLTEERPELVLPGDQLSVHGASVLRISRSEWTMSPVAPQIVCPSSG
jgi:glucose/arabinose dehydrogenase